ncbi:MAG: nicotinamide riboside transporter PnuC [Bacteroidetes bacterium]|nr:nicotinamide riboside transporter PnuC [Bacteroidota bacterium]MDA1119039.1 nicotinamide riboside transporter PnuC [Bacteroidota bacterium]
MTDWINFLIDGLYTGLNQITWVEVVAFGFGVVSVWYEKQENILVFPTGIVNVLLSVYVCLTVGLYADMGINVYYFFMSIYGWINWTRKNDGKKTLLVGYCNRNDRIIMMVLGGGSFLILLFGLTKFTDSDVAFWDSLTTAFFITAMWLLAEKKIENWYAWIIGNLISIPLYFSKGLVLFSFQYLIFLILAIMGLISWRKKAMGK